MTLVDHRQTVRLVGDSHVLALARAIGKLPDLSDRFEISALMLSKVKNGQKFGDIHIDDAVNLLHEGRPDDVLVSVLGGNLYHALSLVRHQVPFSLAGSGIPDMPGATKDTAKDAITLIPRQSFKAALSALMQIKELPRLERLAKAARGPVFHVAAPPPRATDDIDMPAMIRKFPDIEPLGIAPQALRLEAWTIQNEIQQDACARLGITFLAPPTAALTPDGCLRPKLFAPDTTHANVGYGMYVLNQIADQIALTAS